MIAPIDPPRSKSLLDAPRLSMSAAARRARVNTSTIWRWALEGCRGRKLPSVLIGGRRYILERDLEEFVAAGRVPATGSPARPQPAPAGIDESHIEAILDHELGPLPPQVDAEQ